MSSGPSHWVTRERPKIDRIACPWLILRFIDPHAQFHFVPAVEVLSAADRLPALPFDVPNVRFSHRGDHCSFDAFIADFEIDDRGVRQLAIIVRGADTVRLDLAPQAAGLLAISLGLSQRFEDDHEMLAHGLTVYDALYAWAHYARGETHGWPPTHA
ncbi:MAG: chromate resistance protein [Alphaproteobacteria bacterium]|nr:chromate resistance protein [Alphaproteobacteria bacterium]